MLVEPNRTPYDWSFRLFGFRVRVHPLFWLGSALLGNASLQLGVEYLLIWIAAVLVSIVVHELGHAFAFRVFGVESHVVLYVFGGLAVPYSVLPGRGRRALVALAGPVAGFALLGLIYFSNVAFPWAGASPLTRFLYMILIWINLYWGILNLLPVYPLDGGQVCREVCSMFSWRNGVRISLEISIAVGGLIAIYSLACALDLLGEWKAFLPSWFPAGGYYTAILFGLLAYQSYQLLQASRWTENHWDR